MKHLLTSAIFGICVVGSSLAQPPRKLPSSLDDPRPDLSAKPAKPLSPAEAAKQREDIIRAVHEEIEQFDPDGVTVTSKDGHWYLHTRRVTLKDFGTDRGAALEAARIIQDLRVNQLGTVPGANPPFEYWLSEGKAPRGTNAKLIVIPVAARSLNAEFVAGAWMISDGQKGLYNFGKDADAAKRAATICWKYGFNQVGVVGTPQPRMIFPLLNERQAILDKASPKPNAMPLGVLSDADKTGLLLPGNIYAGPKIPLDPKKLEVQRDGRTYVLQHNGVELAKFGTDALMAKRALQTIEKANPTELVRLGERGFPLFLSDGLPIRGEPLGITRIALRPDLMKTLKVRETWWVFEENRPVMEIGTKEDAEIMIKVFQGFGIRSISVFGRPDAGGLRLFTLGR